jgi:hypothetical protein
MAFRLLSSPHPHFRLLTKCQEQYSSFPIVCQIGLNKTFSGPTSLPTCDPHQTYKRFHIGGFCKQIQFTYMLGHEATHSYMLDVFYFISVLLVSRLLCSLATCVVLLVLLFALYFLWIGSYPCLFLYTGFCSYFEPCLYADNDYKTSLHYTKCVE